MLFPVLSVLLFFLLVRGLWHALETWCEGHATEIEAYRKWRRWRQEERVAFLDRVKLGWYQIIVIFAVGSVAGLILEQLWMLITRGTSERRYGLVWGPFSPLYGVGATLLTILCFWLRKKKASGWLVFVASMAVGAALEQLTGWTMETAMGAVSWDYSAWPGALSKWVCIPFCVAWGVLGLVWSKLIMPEVLYRIGEPTGPRHIAFVSLLGVFLALDIFMTLACFGRLAARERGIEPSNAFETWVDEHYSDEFVARRFQNMEIEGVTA